MNFKLLLLNILILVELASCHPVHDPSDRHLCQRDDDDDQDHETFNRRSNNNNNNNTNNEQETFHKFTLIPGDQFDEVSFDEETGASRWSSGGFMDNSGVPPWVATLWTQPSRQHSHDKRLAGIGYNVGQNQLLMHTNSFGNAHTPLDHVEDFITKGIQPTWWKLKEKSAIDVSQGPVKEGFAIEHDTTAKVHENPLNGSPFGVWNLKPTTDIATTLVNQRTPVDTGVRFESNPKEFGKDCFLHSFSEKPFPGGSRGALSGGSDVRHWTKYPIQSTKCEANGKCRLQVGQAPPGHTGEYGPCSGDADKGAPVICGGKVTYLLDAPRVNYGNRCSPLFTAYHTPSIVKNVNFNSFGKTPSY